MYWWNIQALKKELLASPLTDAKIFPYLFVYTIAMGLLIIPVPGEYTQLDIYNGLIGVLVMVAGTYYVYRCNGGAIGKNFLQNYITLSWVVGVRFVVLVMFPVMLLYFVGLSLQDNIRETTTWGDIIFLSLLSPLYYWWLGKHTRDVARGASSAKAPAPIENE